MVEPFVAVLRNSLSPIRGVLQASPAGFAPTTVAMHHHEQHYFSSNIWGPLPRHVKGKERERDGSRLPRVSQCREWTSHLAYHVFCCSGMQTRLYFSRICVSHRIRPWLALYASRVAAGSWTSPLSVSEFSSTPFPPSPESSLADIARSPTETRI